MDERVGSSSKIKYLKIIRVSRFSLVITGAPCIQRDNRVFPHSINHDQVDPR